MRVAEDESIRIERLELGPWPANAYVLVCRKTGQSVLVDAPAEPDMILKALSGTEPCRILLTHNHGDHTGALAVVKARLKVPIAVHEADARGLPVPADTLLHDGDKVTFGEIALDVLHTPGHTAGGLCFRTTRYLISGDTIFPGGPGKTWSPAYFRQIVKSITEKIFALPDDTVVFPGHGESSVLKKEKAEFAAFASRPPTPNLYGDVVWLTS